MSIHAYKIFSPDVLIIDKSTLTHVEWRRIRKFVAHCQPGASFINMF